MELYNKGFQDTQSGATTGIDASIRKWESIRDVLQLTHISAGNMCGLCAEHNRDYLCISCPLYRGEGNTCNTAYLEARVALRVARNATEAMLESLYEVKKQPKWEPFVPILGLEDDDA